MNRLEGKVALVTGGSMGIGRAIVDRFAAEGAKMVISCDINPCEFEQENVRGEILNVTDREGIKALVKKIVEEFGTIDILVNNAGITQDAPFVRMSEAGGTKSRAVTGRSREKILLLDERRPAAAGK